MREYQGLYRKEFEHENCGIGAVVNSRGIKSRQTVENALKIVENLEHRAGKDATGETGDGVGILLQISHRFFSRVCQEAGIDLGEERSYGIAQMFFPQDDLLRKQAKKMFELIVKKEGMEILGCRRVPVCPEILGAKARDCMPCIEQIFIRKPEKTPKGLAFDRKLYIARREFEQSNDNTYVVSMSSRTIVYKGMFLVGQLRKFFTDLQDEDYDSAIALVHSRFSTNTNPSWERAHPNRLMVHNGEINTIRGNADKMLAREESMESALLKGKMDKVLPVVDTNGSDSAMLDNTLEFLMMSGMELPLAVMITIPEPWSNNKTLSRDERDFYQYYATMMEPWDGPASIVFSDGDLMGAVLDRNGLRPSRYYVMKNGDLILASEVGVLDVPEKEIVEKECLHPGKLLLVDTVEGKILTDKEVKEKYIHNQPYGEWIDGNMVELHDIKIPNLRVEEYDPAKRRKLQKAFGYTYEEYKDSIRNMALNAGEGIAAMGADVPLAVLSEKPRPLFDYFKQLFAQVTNPPIDAIREEIVTCSTVYAGKNGNLLEEAAENCRILKINNPILTNIDMLKIRELKKDGLKVATVSVTYYKSTKLNRAIERLYVEVDKAYKNGANILVLSDRGVDENHLAIPSLLAVSAVHQYLVRTKKQTSLTLILESAEPREVHHFAALLGYGACAVNPYLALDSIHELIEEGSLEKDYYAASEDYCRGILNGIVKIASKMGISTIQSYQGSRLFEAVGISKEVMEQYFGGTVSRVGGITLEDIQRQVDALHSEAFDPLGIEKEITLERLGKHKRKKGGEEHRYDPKTIHLLQQSAWTGNYEMFKEYSAMADQEQHGYLRSLMEFRYPEEGIPMEEVESEEDILRRFKTGAMSYGSLSAEAHETLALAMNRLNGKSNCGEGGESEERLDSEGTDRDCCSAVKQVASGRFGVTSRYLVSAKEIQIKMAQGAKPGEGGHLPAGKVTPWIAKTRHSTPNVSLISPPPHHDIYSIEDLAELIYDLKNANKYADISVKLVAETGVGTVAAGVAKAGAQTILISGCDGGTGAAPESSIHNAGLPWELGLAETHQTLLKNNLRSRVRLETDGKLMTGRDVAVAALLGAEEFGFGTAPLVVLGCVMARVCNLDTCPVGIATQNPELRKRFKGKPEYVENFMRFIARELREYMARLGLRTIEEMVGRSDLLKVKETAELPMAKKIDLREILDNPFAEKADKVTCQPSDAYDFQLEKTIDEGVLLKELGEAVQKGEKAELSVKVKNTDRAFAAILGSEITRCHKDGLQEDTISIRCTGTGGQSFGAFIPKGLTISLCGDCNDYLGKGLSGGKLIVYPPKKRGYMAASNLIAGNVVLYGATGGKVYLNGRAGERFAVRNSGACAVVEGVGEHGCEYMTGGRVVILGNTGKNFAAGMSGGIAYVLDEENHLYRNLNKDMVSMEKVERTSDILELKTLIEEHERYTKSERAAQILDSFQEYLPKFKKVIPHEYRKAMQLTAEQNLLTI